MPQKTRNLEWLIARGLKPHHVVLDVGCGPCGALGMVIGYLDPGNYYGVDRQQEYLYGIGGDNEQHFISEWGTAPTKPYFQPCAMEQLGAAGLFEKRPTLWLSDCFNFAPLGGRKVDFVFCKDVWTHLTEAKIRECLTACREVLSPDGVMFVSFTPSKTGRYEEGPREMMPGFSQGYKTFARYPVDEIVDIVRSTGMKCAYVPDGIVQREARARPTLRITQ